MCRFCLAVCCLLITFPLLAQKTKVIEKKINDKVVKLRYEVMVDTPEIKHGIYESFYYNGNLKEKGSYVRNKKDGKWMKIYNNGTVVEVQYFEMGKKVGIWEKHLENRQVMERFDQEKQIKLEPIIQNIIANYPALAREDQIEGVVEISLKMNEDCSTGSIKIVKDIGYKCGEAALEAVQRIASLKKKYSIGYCNPKVEIIKIEFKLD